MNLYSVGYRVTKKADEITPEDQETIDTNASSLYTHVTADSFQEATVKAFSSEIENLLVVDKVELIAKGVQLG